MVDDNKDAANSMGMLLRRKGNDIRIAHDGLAALEAAESFHPEFVLLDIGLPKLNGYEVARRVRRQPWGRDVILVALTGWGQDEDRSVRWKQASTSTWSSQWRWRLLKNCWLGTCKQQTADESWVRADQTNQPRHGLNVCGTKSVPKVATGEPTYREAKGNLTCGRSC